MPAWNLLKTLLWRETLMAKTAPGSLTGRDFYHLIFFSLYWCQLEKQKFLKFKELALDKRRLKPERSHIKQLLPYSSGIFHRQSALEQIETTIFCFPFQHPLVRGSSEAVLLEVQPAGCGVSVGVCSARQWSERQVQRISSGPHFTALKGTYLHPTVPHILSLGIRLISLVLSLSLLPEHF